MATVTVSLIGSSPARAEPSRLVRFATADGAAWGRLQDDSIIELQPGSGWSGTPAGRILPLAGTRLLPPVQPRKILGILENYPLRDGSLPPHDDQALVKLGRLFGKFPTALAGPGDPVELPPEARSLRVDGQLVAVIGRTARHVTPAEALGFVAGYTLGADISEATWYRTARLVGRSVDTWAPVGPVLVTDVDPAAFTVETRINGRLVETLAARDLVLGVADLVSYFSRYNTLEPGDLIFTGSRLGATEPAVPLQVGDVIEVSGGPLLGTLRNRVVALPPAPSWENTTSTPPPADTARYVRFQDRQGLHFGRLDGAAIGELSGDFLAGGVPTGRSLPLAETVLLPPVRPRKIIGVIRNYFPPDATDRSAPVEDLPARLFLKWPEALGTTGDVIELPPEAGNLNWEGELVVVIGRTARHVSVGQALDHVFGYAAGNDVSENNWGGLIGKAADTWAQISPVLATGLAWDRLHVSTRVNGEQVQAQPTADLVYGVPLLVAYASRYFTLEPGDLIYSGSVRRLPGVPRKFQIGDEVEVTVDGLSSVRNRVVPLPAAPRR